eukprot:TRINITY_DN12170_c0_g1_i12.p3 TRINITY_DN12170_c0_g1~~TRINITY_DN12170_c0_g1_i12.p3  ORF type:complete len:157 (+),score=34.56 TRINITY_DN12170_c0_g1_i12:1911-2381(+)
MAFNVRAFHTAMSPSVTNTMIVERSIYRPRNAQVVGVRSSLDVVTLTSTSGTVYGWALDTGMQGGGLPPVMVRITVDLKPVATVLASDSRPDLVKAGVAPNAEHGFTVQLPSDAVALLQHGKHLIEAFVTDSPSSTPIAQRFAVATCVADGVVNGC